MVMLPKSSGYAGDSVVLSEERDAEGVLTSLVERTALPNGLRVLTERMTGVRSVSIAVYVAVGSRHESVAQHGCSHFLEHLLFKGTPERTAWQISAQMDALGGDFNAYTAKEYTCFHGRVLDENLAESVDLLGDLLTSSVITTADVDAERQVILDEIAMHEDDPDDVVHNLTAAVAWPDSALGRSIAGTVESITQMTQQQILEFYRTHYRPDRMVVCLAGNVRHQDAVALVTKAFARSGFLGQVPPSPGAGQTEAPQFTAGTARVTRDFEQVNLVLGWPGLTRTDPRRFALSVLVTILGGGSSSRLFQQVREQRGLAYAVYAFATHHVDSGMLGVSVGCLPEREAETLAVIKDILDDMLAHGINEDELGRAQQQLRRGMILGLEDPAARVNRMGKSELFADELLTTNEVVERLTAVTTTEVADLAKDLLAGVSLQAAVGPGRG